MIVDIFGDVHAEFKKLEFMWGCVIPRADVLICCGDFGYWPNSKFYCDLRDIDFKNTKVYFCDGNHENHEQLRNLGINNEIHKNVFYMKRGTILGLNNKNILFMGGASSIDSHLRTPGYDWFVEENISDEDIENFEKNYKEFKNIDIVISHTCPSEFDIIDHLKLKIPDSNRDKLSYILEKTKPEYWYFGHYHMFKKGVYKNTKWTALSEAKDRGRNFKARIIL